MTSLISYRAILNCWRIARVWGKVAQEALNTSCCTPGCIIPLEPLKMENIYWYFMVLGSIGQSWAFSLEVGVLEVHLTHLIQNTVIALCVYISPMLNGMRFAFDLLLIKPFSGVLVLKPIPQGNGNKLVTFWNVRCLHNASGVMELGSRQWLSWWLLTSFSIWYSVFHQFLQKESNKTMFSDTAHSWKSVSQGIEKA